MIGWLLTIGVALLVALFVVWFLSPDTRFLSSEEMKHKRLQKEERR